MLVREAGNGSRWLSNLASGSVVNALLPLGNGFVVPSEQNASPLLVGGGVGIAPLVLLAKTFFKNGIKPNVLIGGRTGGQLLEVDVMKQYGNVFITTEDGSVGTKGLVTESNVCDEPHSIVYCCGPLPMMKAIGKICRSKNVPCYVSLENTMACGIGACLCCVEKTVKGNKCVCTDGPVFNIDELTWH